MRRGKAVLALGGLAGAAALGLGGSMAAKRQPLPLPARYDLREDGAGPWIRDQGDQNTCWAFASVTALETSMKEEERIPLSADHMIHKNSAGLAAAAGGDYSLSWAYLLSWQGPAAEADDPYGDHVSPEGLSPVCHVQTVKLLGKKDYDAIKRAVYETGGVQSSLYLPEQGGRDRSAYFYDGAHEANHDVVIVGWDDSFPREAFSPQPEGDGAFLCANSWGEGFGEQGFFYVSYEDTQIGRHNISYAGVESAENYSHIFQTDLCGWTGQLGYGKEEAWCANVYEAEEKGTVEAAGFYAMVPDTEYALYGAAVPGDMEPREILSGLGGDRMPLLASGRLGEAGFYTIPFEAPVEVKAGSRFAVALWIRSPGTEQPVAIEYNGGGRWGNVDITDGEGYISPDGTQWMRAEEREACNVCLKTYGNGA